MVNMRVSFNQVAIGTYRSHDDRTQFFSIRNHPAFLMSISFSSISSITTLALSVVNRIAAVAGFRVIVFTFQIVFWVMVTPPVFSSI
jgi:hypothetical protein